MGGSASAWIDGTRGVDAPVSRRRMPEPVWLRRGVGALLHGRFDQALSECEDALAFGIRDGDTSVQRDAALHLALVHAARGRLHQAERALAVASAVHSAGRPAVAGSVANSVVGGVMGGVEATARLLIAVEHGDAEAERVVEDASSDSADWFWPLRLLAIVRWRHARGEPEALLATFDEARRRLSAGTGALAADIVEACLLRAGAASSMAGAATTGVPRVRTTGRALLAAGPERGVEATLAGVLAALRAGRPDAAARAARHLGVRADVGPSVRAEALLLGVWAEESAGGSCDEVRLRAAAALVAAEGIWRPLAVVPVRVRDACIERMPERARHRVPEWILRGTPAAAPVRIDTVRPAAHDEPDGSDAPSARNLADSE